MSGLTLRSLACSRSSSAKRCAVSRGPPRLVLTRFQLYIGEACWAFLFGVVIGGCSVYIVGRLKLIGLRAVWRQHLRPQELGERKSRNHEHHYARIHARCPRYWRFRHRSRVAEGLHGPPLEESHVSPGAYYDMGACIYASGSRLLSLIRVRRAGSCQPASSMHLFLVSTSSPHWP